MSWEDRLDKELRFHLEQHVADLIAEGHTPREARRIARIELGGAEQVKEGCRDARPTRWLHDLRQDFQYALRTLARKPGFAAVALLTLALGCGATTVMFTVINGVLLRPLAYAHPERLLRLQEKTVQATRFGNLWAFAYPNYLDCQREAHSVSMAAFRFSVGTASAHGEAQYVSGREISAGLFSLLATPLERGREFRPDEDQPGGPPALILSHHLWQSLFAGDPAALGKPLTVDGKPYTVVGIAPASFRLEGEEPDVYLPLGQDSSPNLKNRNRHPGITVYARLHDGVSPAAAQAELSLIGRQLAVQYPDSNKDRSFVADPLRPEVGDVGSMLWLLLGAVSLVLLIACVNVASLLLARAVSRERELAMRVALGASRGRLVRQCLTESAVLGLSGGLLGVVLAAVGIRPFLALWPGTLPRAEEVHIDWRVLLFAVAASLVSGLLFGLAPAWRAPVRNVEQALRAGGRTITGGARRLHAAFVVSEIGLAVVLLVAAGTLGRTMLRLSALNPGMDCHNVLISRIALSPAALTKPAQTRAAWDDVLEHARRIPGVQFAAAVDTVPMREGYNELSYWTSAALPPAKEQPSALATSATPDYLNVMAIPLLHGRFFNDHDRLASQPVVVIDDVLAQQAFGAQNAVGQRLWLPPESSPFASDPNTAVPVQVVGVVGHVRHWGLAGDDQAAVRAQLYYPFAQVADPLVHRWSDLMSVVVRTNAAPLSLVDPLRKELRSATGGASGDQALYEVRTMEQLVSDSLARQRFLLLLFGIFAGLALTLACIGIYGVMAYLTSRRVPEIGVRLALGATAGEVVWMVLRQSLWMILGGVAVGTLAALAAARTLERLVEGVRPTDLSTWAIPTLVLVAAALLASLLPARRASRIDPLTALRQE
ncbi:MAG TPA: ABC transporter permease [Candidatus Sulfopaludibacter sp.]|jgi:predicted permease|nr:ABC transporter permease [Candidatus Sulfopaludibacter sp.]